MLKSITLPTLGFGLSVLAAAIATPAVAREDGPPPVPRYGVETQAPSFAPLVEGRNVDTGNVVEGRNATVSAPAPRGVEPYIASTIEQDRRATR